MTEFCVSNEPRRVMIWTIVVGIPVVLAALHRRTDGRSSPVAALGFVLSGPVLGVLLLIPAAAKEAQAPGCPYRTCYTA